MAIQNTTMDEVILELARTMKALKALKAVRSKKGPVICLRRPCDKTKGMVFEGDGSDRCKCGGVLTPAAHEFKQHAAVKRASMDLSRVLADLRQGR